jgi:hypothetical protein
VAAIGAVTILDAVDFPEKGKTCTMREIPDKIIAATDTG